MIVWQRKKSNFRILEYSSELINMYDIYTTTCWPTQVVGLTHTTFNNCKLKYIIKSWLESSLTLFQKIGESVETLERLNHKSSPLLNKPNKTRIRYQNNNRIVQSFLGKIVQSFAFESL